MYVCTAPIFKPDFHLDFSGFLIFDFAVLYIQIDLIVSNRSVQLSDWSKTKNEGRMFASLTQLPILCCYFKGCFFLLTSNASFQCPSYLLPFLLSFNFFPLFYHFFAFTLLSLRMFLSSTTGFSLCMWCCSPLLIESCFSNVTTDFFLNMRLNTLCNQIN